MNILKQTAVQDKEESFKKSMTWYTLNPSEVGVDPKLGRVDLHTARLNLYHGPDGRLVLRSKGEDSEMIY